MWLSLVGVISVARSVRKMPGEFRQWPCVVGRSLNYQWRHCV
jgi:hypothetical protein